MVSGPFKVNGVPLKRVNQAYVIATSTKVDVSGVKVPEKVNDAYFAKPKTATKKSEEAFFAKDAKKKEVSADKLADQKAVDEALLAAVKKVEHLSAYLGSVFSLKPGQFPHDLKF